MTADELELAEARAELRVAVRRFFEQRSPEAEVRRVMEEPEGVDRSLWAQLAGELGVPSLVVPERAGGAGASALELGIVLEEAGRALVCAPLLATTVLATRALLTAGVAAGELLADIAEGRTTATLAADLDAGPWTAEQCGVVAREDGATWELDGTVPFVLDGATADLVLVPARVGETVALFEAVASPARIRTSLPTMDLTRRIGRVELVHAPGRLVGFPAEAGWLTEVWLHAVAALAAEQVGVAARALELATSYARARVQFGRPIGSFQAIKHRCADMLVAVESARSAADAALRSAAGLDDDLPLTAAIAGSCCSEAATFVTAECVQIHGGIGFTWEHSAHLYLKRAKSAQLMLGQPALHRRLLAEQLGLLSAGVTA